MSDGSEMATLLLLFSMPAGIARRALLLGIEDITAKARVHRGLHLGR